MPYAQYAHKGAGKGGKQARSFSEMELYKVGVWGDLCLVFGDGA